MLVVINVHLLDERREHNEETEVDAARQDVQGGPHCVLLLLATAHSSNTRVRVRAVVCFTDAHQRVQLCELWFRLRQKHAWGARFRTCRRPGAVSTAYVTTLWHEQQRGPRRSSSSSSSCGPRRRSMMRRGPRAQGGKAPCAIAAQGRRADCDCHAQLPVRVTKLVTKVARENGAETGTPGLAPLSLNAQQALRCAA